MTGARVGYPVPARLQLPVDSYNQDGYRFGQRVRSRVILWARHLGEDILAKPGMNVKAIGAGEVVWSETRLGGPNKRNWGGIVIIGHQHKETGQAFFSLYGHMTDITVKAGDEVGLGQPIGVIAGGQTPENGWWKLPHLHFSVYTGPWTNQVLPGYTRFFEGRTKFRWWSRPRQFIEEYNRQPA